MLLATGAVESYAGVLAVMIIAVLLAGSILVLPHLIGPRRRGPVKDGAYESGVAPVGDARRRLHIRFYIVAVLFLLFDVEVLLLWPVAPVYTRVCRGEEALRLADGTAAGPGFLLVAMGLFVLLLVVGLVYEWRRGVFRWD